MKRKEREYALLDIGVVIGKLCTEHSLSLKSQEKMLKEAYKAFYIWETEMAESDITYESYITNIFNKKLKETYCDYCMGAKPLETGEINDKGIAIRFPSYLMAYGYDIHGSGANGLNVRINYCPMCGRKISNEKKGD